MLIGLSVLLTYLILINMNFPILSTLIFLPLLGVLFLFFYLKVKKIIKVQFMFLIYSISYIFIIFISLVFFRSNSAEFQFVEEKSWISDFIKFKLGVDGISILFIVLTAFITPICIISCINSVKIKSKRVFNSYLNFRNIYDRSFLFFRFSNFLFIF